MEPRGELSLVLDDWATDGLLEVGSFGVDCCDWYCVNGDCGDCSCLAGTHDGADVRIVAGRKVLTPSTCRSRLPRCYRPAPNGPSGLLLSDLAVWDGHVAMVVGNGMMIEAGDPVQLVAAAARRSDEELDNTHLKRIAGRFARRVQGQGQRRGPLLDRRYPLAEAGKPVHLSPIRTTNAGQGFQGFFRPTA